MLGFYPPIGVFPFLWIFRFSFRWNMWLFWWVHLVTFFEIDKTGYNNFVVLLSQGWISHVWIAHVVFTLNIVLISSLCCIYTYTIEGIPWASFTFNWANMRLSAVLCTRFVIVLISLFRHLCLVEFCSNEIALAAWICLKYVVDGTHRVFFLFVGLL